LTSEGRKYETAKNSASEGLERGRLPDNKLRKSGNTVVSYEMNGRSAADVASSAGRSVKRELRTNLDTHGFRRSEEISSSALTKALV